MKKKIIIVLVSFAFLAKNTSNGIASESLQSMDNINENIQMDIHSGWRFHNNSWFFYDTNGQMKTGWICPDSITWYYLSDSGSLLMNTVTPDGYRVNESGAWMPDARTYLGIDFLKEDIESIDFYNIPVPIAAKMKRITKKEDITLLYNIVNNFIIVEKDKNYSPKTGGIYYFKFLKKDGTDVILSISTPFVGYAEQKYMFKNTLMIEELWESMEYDALSVSQETYLRDLTIL